MATKEGVKTGGRSKGKANSATQEIIDKLEALGCDPATGLAMIAMDPETKPELKVKAYSELSKYIYPQRKAIEHSGEVGQYQVGVESAEQLSTTLRSLEESSTPPETTVQ